MCFEDRSAMIASTVARTTSPLMDIDTLYNTYYMTQWCAQKDDYYMALIAVSGIIQANVQHMNPLFFTKECHVNS